MAPPVSSHPMLDHVVILVSPSTLDNIEDEDISMAFTIYPGGEHANGVTYNKLILFRDGFYIELIAFKKDAAPEAKAAHPWGKSKENTIVDFAFTLGHVDVLREVEERIAKADTQFEYQEPWRMGRIREDDGMELKWFMSLAQRKDRSGQNKSVKPGILPFFCLDDTPRWFRVPFLGNIATMHNFSSNGPSRLRIHIPEDEDFAGVEKVYKAMLGDELKFLHPSLKSDIKERHQIELVKLPAGEERRIELILASNSHNEEEEWLPGLKIGYEYSLQRPNDDATNEEGS